MENYIEKSLELLVKSMESEHIKKHYKLITDLYGKMEDTYTCKALLKEFRTIKICAARQSGHTTAIFNYADKRKNKKFLLLVYNQDIVSRHNKMLKDREIKNVVCYSTQAIKGTECPDNLRGYNFEAIFIDMASMLSKSNIENIYAFAEQFYHINNNMLLIFVE